jgi:hypothetical protein
VHLISTSLCKEVNCTEPYPSVRVPWLKKRGKKWRGLSIPPTGCYYWCPILWMISLHFFCVRGRHCGSVEECEEGKRSRVQFEAKSVCLSVRTLWGREERDRDIKRKVVKSRDIYRGRDIKREALKSRDRQLYTKPEVEAERDKCRYRERQTHTDIETGR